MGEGGRGEEEWRKVYSSIKTRQKVNKRSIVG